MLLGIDHVKPRGDDSQCRPSCRERPAVRLSITASRQATDDYRPTPRRLIAQLVGTGCSRGVGLPRPHDTDRARSLNELAIAQTIEEERTPCSEASQPLGIARGKDGVEANPKLFAALEERPGSRPPLLQLRLIGVKQRREV